MPKILVVEDEELIRTMIGLNLEKEGFDATCVGDAETALDLASRETWDVILLDIMLPGASGIEALKTLRARGDATPVLMLTAKGDINTKLQSFSLGSDDYLTKPFDVKELLARVRVLLRHRER